MSTLIWKTPATSNGAAPVYSTLASSPPTVTVTGAFGFGNTAVASNPSTPGGDVCPSPVPKRTMVEPTAAGVAGVFRDPSWFRIAPAPDAFRMNNPGAVAATDNCMRSDFTRLYSTEA